MHRPHGYSVTADPETGRPVEADVMRCCHCQRISEVPPGAMTGFPWCWKCGAPTCQQQACIETCHPWERKIEQMEARESLWRITRGR